MTVGLGTGSTVAFLPALAARSLHLRCVATSPRTEEAAAGRACPSRRSTRSTAWT